MRLCNKAILVLLLAGAALALPTRQAPAQTQAPSLTVDRDPVRSPDGEVPAPSQVRKQGEGYVLHTDVEEVLLNCTVLEGNRLATDLKRENFQVKIGRASWRERVCAYV
jgi:uncharacterized protein (DUF2141 family)